MSSYMSITCLSYMLELKTIDLINFYFSLLFLFYFPFILFWEDLGLGLV